MRATGAIGAAAVAFCSAGTSVASPSTQSTSLNCKNIVIPVTASAQNLALPSNLTLADLTPAFMASVPTIPTQTVSGTYNIAARFCLPSRSVASRAQTLQVLIPGLTYTSNYWSGLAPPGTKPGQDLNSYVVFAAAAGYPTLSIDRLCTGNSSKPNGIAACQLPLEAETVHQVVLAAKAGKLPGISTVWNKVILFGHSFGSLLTDLLLTQHPSDPSAVILSGFSENLTNSLPDAGNLEFTVAETYDPSAYPGPDPSYLVDSNQTGVTYLFYTGDFDPNVAAYDYANRGSTTIGEFVTQSMGETPVPNYAGPLGLLVGNNDRAYCSGPPPAILDGQPGNCTEYQYQNYVKQAYPKAQPFNYFFTPDTGHCLNLHRTAPASFAAALAWLQEIGF